MAGNRPVILDTCALLWVTQGGGALSKVARRRLEQAPIVYVSAISGFEVGVKYRKGKLELPTEPLEWFQTILANHNLLVAPLDLSVCIRATELPVIHADPCDRLIIATAQLQHLTVVTRDPVFAQYGVETLT